MSQELLSRPRRRRGAAYWLAEHRVTRSSHWSTQNATHLGQATLPLLLAAPSRSARASSRFALGRTRASRGAAPSLPTEAPSALSRSRWTRAFVPPAPG